MISVSSLMTFGAIVLSAVLGISFGAFYSMIMLILGSVKRLSKRTASETEKAVKIISLTHNILDFLFVISLGIAYMLLSYACTDGDVSLYSLCSLLLGFFGGKGLFQLIARSKKRN